MSGRASRRNFWKVEQRKGKLVANSTPYLKTEVQWDMGSIHIRCNISKLGQFNFQIPLKFKFTGIAVQEVKFEPTIPKLQTTL